MNRITGESRGKKEGWDLEAGRLGDGVIRSMGVGQDRKLDWIKLVRYQKTTEAGHSTELGECFL
jgi:hypothetical protein